MVVLAVNKYLLPYNTKVIVVQLLKENKFSLILVIFPNTSCI